MTEKRASVTKSYKSPFHKQSECLCCGAGQTSLKSFFSMGMRPPCNRLVTRKEDDPECFPLEICYCEECYHQQLTHIVDSDVMFKSYPYRTGMSYSHTKHFTRLGGFIRDLFSRQEISRTSDKTIKIMDVGSNDGTLLRCIRKHDVREMTYERHACDPYVEPDPGNAEYYHKTKWHEEEVSLGMKFHCITATNVLAHNPDPRMFIKNCVNHLFINGFLVIETPCSHDLVKHNRFDTIYHEHISYWNIASLLRLLSPFPLEIFQVVEVNDHHGKTLRIVARLCPPEQKSVVMQSIASIKDQFSKEIYDLMNDRFYREFEKTVWKIAEINKKIIEEHEDDGFLIVGYGASAKGITQVNYLGSQLQYIADITPQKQGLYTPSSRIKIISPDDPILKKKNQKILFLLYTWNSMEETMSRLRDGFNNSIEHKYYWYGMDKPMPLHT